MQVPQFIALYQVAVLSTDVLPQLTKEQHVLLLKTRQPMQARTHIFEGEMLQPCDTDPRKSSP
jgi:hypothetical protein